MWELPQVPRWGERGRRIVRATAFGWIAHRHAITSDGGQRATKVSAAAPVDAADIDDDRVSAPAAATVAEDRASDVRGAASLRARVAGLRHG